MEAKLLGFNLTKINVEKNQDYQGEVQLKSNIDITSIEKHESTMIKDESIKISFNFGLDYGSLGNLNFNGYMYLLFDKESTKKILENWEKKKPINEEINTLIINIILQRCTLRALQLEEELALPFHIQLPQAKLQTPKESK